MPRYQYTAISGGGKKSKGTVTAESSYAARKQLRMRGVHPTKIEEVGNKSESKFGFNVSFSKSNKKQLIDFTKEMATLLNSGIKLTESLVVMARQATDVRFRNALVDIQDRVVTGESLTDAMKDYGDYFDVIYISMVKVGEVTGSLGEIFATIATFMAKRQKMESKLITAMVYPAILIFFCIVAVMVLTVKVVPMIGHQIESTGGELPWITKQLMNVGVVFTTWRIFVVMGVIIAIVWIVKRFLRTEKGSFFCDKMLLSLPLFGPLIKQRVVARFTSTLSTLLASGLSMAESLRIVAEVTGNKLMSRAIRQSRERILSGADISTPLRESGVIDQTIIHMVAVGEKSGELELMLKNISENLEANSDIVIERLSTAIEPIIIVIMTGIIGLIAYATILPILEVSGGF